MNEKRCSNLPLISLPIVNYNGAKFLKQCLTSVLSADYPKLEVIFFDNGSSDDSVDLVRKIFSDNPHLTIIENSRNIGLAKAANICAKIASGKYLLFLDTDTQIEGNCVKEIVNVLEKNPNVGGGQCKLLYIDDRKIFYSTGTFLDTVGICHYRGVNKIDKGQYNSISSIFAAIGAAFFVRKELFDRLGGFDEDYFTWGEDIDLCWRIWLSGHKVIFIPTAVVYHKGSGTSGRVNERRRVCITYRNWIITKVKNHEKARNMVIYLFFLFLFGVINIKKSYLVAILSSISYNILHFKETWRKRLQVQPLITITTKQLIEEGILWKFDVKRIISNHNKGVLSE